MKKGRFNERLFSGLDDWLAWNEGGWRENSSDDWANVVSEWHERVKKEQLSYWNPECSEW